jgi:hypothetical protein
MIKQLKIVLLVISIALIHTSTSFGSETKDASVSVFVFFKGDPLYLIDIIENGKIIGTTDNFGSTKIQLKPGSHTWTFKSEEDEIYQHTLEVSAGEIVQLLVDIKEKESADVSLESSKQSENQTDTTLVQNADESSGIMTKLSGQIISAENQKPISNARIYISGISGNLFTDEKGQFSTEILSGKYNLSVLHAKFNSTLKPNIEISEGGLTDLVIELTPSGTELPEFVVIAPFIEGSLASVLEERKQNNSVANYLSMEQISKSGDSDAAGALKRVTGLTLVDGKFIYVRGLGERYSSTLLNGANLPSPDPTRRVVPLDLFPTGIIRSIEVQKGYSASLPAEFGGGTVTLKTISIPEENFLNLGLSYGHNTQTTGKDGLTYDGGSNDWLGRDDGSRDIPQLLYDAIAGGTELRPSNPFVPGGYEPEILEQIGESLSNNYNLHNEKIDPNSGFSLAGGMRKDLESGVVLGFSSALDYGSSYQTRSELRRDFIVSSGDTLVLDSEELSQTTRRGVDLSAFLTSGIEFSENNKVSANYMVLRNSSDFAEIAEGYNEDLGNSRRIYEIRWTERELSSSQYFGEHVFPEISNLKFDWQFTDSQAKFDEPDNRIYRYDRREEGDFIFSTRNDSNSRVWRELEDLSRNIRYDLTLPFSIKDNHDIALKFGQNWVYKDRNSDIRRFVFEDVGSLVNQIDRSLDLESILSPEFIAPNGYQLQEVTRATDNYFANLDTKAKYLGVDYSYKELLNISLGMRHENVNQSVTTFKLFDPDQNPVTASLEDKSYYPAFSSALFLPADNQLRLNYSETATRPDFKELSPAQFKDPVLDRNVIGNPDLLAGSIKHYDLRWDKYFSESEFVSVSLFYKQFFNPIEMIILPGSSRIISFDNAESAENYGVELEVYKTLSFMNRFSEHDFWSDIYISGNYAYIESEIVLGTDRPGGQTNNSRPLQGQSPYVGNLQLGYDNLDKDLSVSLLYNIFGERISEAGTSGRPDIYEQPFNQLDLVISKKLFDRFKFKIKATNLLDDEVIFLQGDEVTRKFTKGRTFSISIDYDIF